ncbi:cell division protein FtsA [Caloramator quimbayensis]|uniref:Cell division protein FtsA n=1 Tax=Caloramator quimbayensis TaxID=1147123 RepID=A0A1T4Y2Y7_9CLOT|nr:cell division FtsA domain-containing protein [Caloramator quimbayensis]SKA95691.1 cell division protein FtsA [Caloramator quimbayensis]
MNNDDFVFALDIGTRTVVGVIGYEKDDMFEVAAIEVLEHKSRAMYDGQVHDIDEVAKVVIKIKEKLEKRLGLSLNKVAIAAAGRALKTKKININKSFDFICDINSEMISSLEMEGIELAQKSIDDDLMEDEKTTYYCVGYSIINYYLNGYIISTLLNHRGKSIGADILATFLPQTVIESLYAVVKKANLEVSNLTLEPIAAINVAIPKDLRMLNLCLVDIGAGTSDIAITKDGSVVAYAMVPIAGDEITETICQNYLVDFNTAEKIKLSLSSKKEITFTDVMGIKQVKKSQEIKEVIKNSVENLSDSIVQKILEYNGKAPGAVFLIGGGSKIENLDKFVAQKLNLPIQRVAVRGTEVLKNVKYRGKKISGPEIITPLGIAATANMQRGRNFIYVNVNEKEIKLLNSRKLMVSDALIYAGFRGEQIIGRNGKPVNFILNGVEKTILGGMAKPCEVYVNGEPQNLKTEINNGDNIIIKTAQSGEDAVVTVNDLYELYGFNDAAAKVNGEYVQRDYVIANGDNIEIKEENNIKNYELGELKDEVAAAKELKDGIEVIVNGNKIKLVGKEEYIFVDIFNYIDFDISKAKGITLKLNGKDAAYTDVLKDGDSIDIYLEQE